jgi:hypothetical protein
MSGRLDITVVGLSTIGDDGKASCVASGLVWDLARLSRGLL